MSEPFNYEKWMANQQGKSYDIVRRIEKNWREMNAGRRKGYEIALFVATSFGVHRIVCLFPLGSDTIVMSIYGESEFGGILYAPAEQCAFMFQHFRPTPDKPKVILGFAPPNKDEAQA